MSYEQTIAYIRALRVAAKLVFDMQDYPVASIASRLRDRADNLLKKVPTGVMTMEPIAIEFDDQGRPLNLPKHQLVMVFGRNGLDAEGPELAYVDGLSGRWITSRDEPLPWNPLFFAFLPDHPCRSISEPTVLNEVV